MRFLLTDLTENKYYGLVQTATENKALAITAEYPLAFSAYVYKPAPDINDDAEFYLDLKFRDGDGNVIDTQLFNLDPDVKITWTRMSSVFTPPPGTKSVDFSIYLRKNGYYFLSSPKLERGNIPSDWSTSSEDVSFVKRALKGTTLINGGLVMSSMVLLGEQVNYDFRVWSGMSGLYSETSPNKGIAFFAGGSPLDENRIPTYVINHDGTGYAANKVIKFNDYDITVGENVSLNRNGLELRNDEGQIRLQIGNIPIPKDLKTHDIQNFDSFRELSLKEIPATYVEQYTDETGFIWYARLIFEKEVSEEKTVVSAVAETSSMMFYFETQIPTLHSLDPTTAILAEVEYTLYEHDNAGGKHTIAESRRVLTLNNGILQSSVAFDVDLVVGCSYSAAYRIVPTNLEAAPEGIGIKLNAQATTVFAGDVYLGKDIRVILGNDGFLSQWPNTKQLHYDGCWGVVVGTYGFRITAENGFERSYDGGDTWEVI